MLIAVISISLFTLRFFWSLVGSKQLDKKWVKVLPHAVDTMLLLLGIGLIVQYGYNPLHHTWLLEKLLAVFAYIFTGYYALKLARNKVFQILGYVGAIGWVVLIVRLAMSKQPVLFG